jgi:hypothetical protein
MGRPSMEELDTTMKELATLKKIAGLLQPMDAAAQQRVLAYLTQALSPDAAPAKQGEAN